MRCTIWAVAVTALLVAGCSKPHSANGPALPTGRKIQIGFAMTLNDPYWHNMELGARDEAAKNNADITITNAEEDVQKQAQQINDFIAKGVDIVCMVPMKPEPLVNAVRALNMAKIPVIIVNRDIGPGCNYVTYTGTDTYAGAVTSAEILMKTIGGKGQIVEFQQVLGTGPQILRSKALEDVLKKYPGVTVVERIPHEGKSDKVVTDVGTLLQKYPKLKGIYVHGDEQAVPAAEACISAGRKDIAVVGMGGGKIAIAAIRAGKLTGTSYQQPEEEGRSAVRLAVKCLKGEKLAKRYPILCPAITKENADKFEGQF